MEVDTTTTASTSSSTTSSSHWSYPTSGCAARLYDIPTQDAACAIRWGGNHTELMDACCGRADVVGYYDSCGLYCLAVGQPVSSIIECLFAHGSGYNDVFCRGDVTATATAPNAALPTNVAISVVVSKNSARETHVPDAGGDESPEGKGGAEGAAAPALRAGGSVTTMGLVIGGLLLGATNFALFRM
ncbi:hypothetical protein F5B20DRAFT_518774 [Whalleya microplaca]|nr:hypothetical protein F5B20DRAFT_518774 [Whalleya microplaca]